MELKDSMTQTTAEPEPSLAEGLSEGRELAMLASSTATPPLRPKKRLPSRLWPTSVQPG